MIVIEAKSAEDIYKNAYKLFSTRKTEGLVNGRTGDTLEQLNVSFLLKDPTSRWVISRRPAINIAFAIVEIVWILQGRNDSKFLNYFNSQLHKFQGDGDEYYGAYGYRLRVNLGIDQLLKAYEAFTNNPHTRQVVLQIWDGQTDLPNSDGSPRDQDIPCNIVSLLKVRENKLHWFQVMRSNDLFLGLPHNIVQFTYLHEVMSGWLGLELGDYVHYSDSLHLYERDFKKFKVSDDEKVAVNTDKIQLNYKKSEQYFSEFADIIDKFVSEELTEEQHYNLSQWLNAPEALRNMMKIVAAEAARRRGWNDLTETLGAECNNSAFIELWNNWLARVSKRKKKK